MRYFIIHDLDRIGLIGVNGNARLPRRPFGVSGFDGDVVPFGKE